jgi:tRNA A58 N-methylase Trm61
MLLIGVMLGIVLLGSAAGLLLSRTSGRALLGRVFSAVTGRTLSIDVSQPTVVDRIQRLQRLETVVYTMDKLVTGAKENVLPDFLTGDRLLLMVHGEVVAGVDLSSLKMDDVRVEGKQVHLHLPAPQVFTTRLDSTKTRVYSRQTGLLVPTDPNLETQVRQEAERQLLEAAMAGGILRTAQMNAISTIRSLLQGLGFERIDID